MTFYCHTTDCLRDYMLRYFGEYGSSYCGNCSNCLQSFETIDITQIANNLIGCTLTSGMRFGTPAVTSRGMKEDEMVQIAGMIARLVEEGESAVAQVKEQAIELCRTFPLYPEM